ncbi:MAG: apolipoprotein N-acyltransferase, partial [Phycisphaerales bacterium]
WTGADFFRGEVAFDGYPWGFASHPLIEWWPAAAPGALGGVYFATFLVALLAGAIVDLAHRRSRTGLIALAAAAAGWGAGLIAVGVSTAPGREVRVAILQTNVLQDNKLKWTIETQLDCWREMRAMALAAPESRPSFVVWPETMMPGFTISPEACQVLIDNAVVFKTQDGHELRATLFRDDLISLQRETNLPMLVGDEAIEGLRVEEVEEGLEFPSDHRFNSVFLVDGGRVGERYDKMHLTPFGEVMPYINQWPWLQQQLIEIGAQGMKFNLSQGRRRTVLRVRDAQGGDPIRVAAPICFESTDASIVRNLVFANGERRADLIAFVTNDGWFGDFDSTRLQHLQAARWRCLELGTPGVRSANTGLSAAIDARGRVVRSGTDDAPGASRVSGVLNVTPALGTGTTIYARIGDLWGWMCLAACPILALSAGRMARARARDTLDNAAGAAGGHRR